MTFQISKHAAKRLKQRGIEDPNDLPLVSCSKKTRRKIGQSRHNRIFEKGKYYFKRRNSPVIYICKLLKNGKYLLVTAFDLSEKDRTEKPS